MVSRKLIDSKIIELRSKFILIDRDVAKLYGAETKRVNEAVSNNPDKFPKDYMLELTKDEKMEVVEHFDHLEPMKYSPYLPKAFTKKGLWMLATILSSKKAKETTFLIIETFDKIDNLKQLEKMKDSKLKEQLAQKSGEIIADILETPEEYDTDTETSVEVNFGLLKYKRVVKKIQKKES